FLFIKFIKPFFFIVFSIFLKTTNQSTCNPSKISRSNVFQFLFRQSKAPSLLPHRQQYPTVAESRGVPFCVLPILPGLHRLPNPYQLHLYKSPLWPNFQRRCASTYSARPLPYLYADGDLP